MRRLLRHFSVRFWLLTLMALPLSFWSLPWLKTWFETVPVLLIFAGLFVLMGICLGLGLDFLGTARLKSLVREGELWEHAGIMARAEKKYIQALGMFDSVWVSPWAGRRCEPILTRALGRFFLNGGSRHPGFRMAADFSLRANPGDKTLAMLWLARSGAAGRADGQVQSVLTALADAHYDDPDMALALVGPFLDLGRVDYSARRLYQGFFDGPDVVEKDGAGALKEIRARIDTLVGDHEMRSGQHLSLKSDPAAAPVFGKYQTGTGQGLDEIEIQRELGPDSLGQVSGQPVSVSARIKGCIKRCWAAISGVLSQIKQGGVTRFKQIRKKEKLGLYFRAGVMGLMGIWLIFFVFTTLSHMFKSTQPPGQKIHVLIPKKLTIQVAAYLKLVHAERYAASLKDKGIEAHIKKTKGGGKTWYLVRVSSFTDKKTAADFGNRLKDQKIIEDFFVSNK
ncbi:MAG: SPOR domain-containing protein [Desulfobacter sp.]|nr:SPOR domain-containing protein [Desulfobacter sp.]